MNSRSRSNGKIFFLSTLTFSLIEHFSLLVLDHGIVHPEFAAFTLF
jgi:hypothetical protein